MAEYASILAVTGGDILSSLTSFDLFSQPYLVTFGVLFGLWVVVFKLN